METGAQVATFFSEVDDTEQPYGLYIPQTYDKNKKYPLVIMLHGAYSNHRLTLRRVFGKGNFPPNETDAEGTRTFPAWPNIDYLVAAPLARGTMGYQGVPEKDVYDVLADVKTRFSIDENRVYLTGYSMGGLGTLWLGLTRPDVWAAIAPICPPVAPEYLFDNALNIPVHLFHGDADPVVPVEGTRKMYAQMVERGVSVKYEEYPGILHNAWDYAYEAGFIFEWFSNFVRDSYPNRVRFTTDRYKYGMAYWVHLDKISLDQLATIDAVFTATNNICIKTKGVLGFTLKLEGHPMFKSESPLSVEVDGQLLEVQVSNSFSLSHESGTWTDVVTNIGSGKRHGSEGPIREALSSSHIYVYGSQGDPSEHEWEARVTHAANAASAWSRYRPVTIRDREERLMTIIASPNLLFPRVLADREVRPSDYKRSNLILFGTRDTNSLIERYSPLLPMHMDVQKTGPCQYGLLYVYPIDGHYIVVNSGLPWSPPTDYRKVSRLWLDSDFIVWKDTPDNLIIEGKFDEYWDLRPEDADVLRTVGINCR